MIRTAGPPNGPPRDRLAGQRLLVASFNPGKARELAQLVAGCGFTTVTLTEAGVNEPYDETGSTYEENALGKARHYATLSGLIAVADDSGIEVDALGGTPGPSSARYGAAGLDDAGRCRLLLSEIDGVPAPQRTARYVAVAVIARPDGGARSFRGVCEGRITTAMRGSGGFGYDPIFFYPPFDATLAEVTAARKHGISHRGAALAALARFLSTDEGRRFLMDPVAIG